MKFSDIIMLQYFVSLASNGHTIIQYLYPTQRVAEGIMFLTRPSVIQSVRQFCFSCQRNSSKNAQQNFVKLCSYEGQCVDAHVHRKF